MKTESKRQIERNGGTGVTRQAYGSAAEDMIYLVSCAVHQTLPDAVRVRDMNLEEVYRTADSQLLAAAAASALEAAGINDPAFRQARAKAIRKTALMDAEMQALFNRLDGAGIWHMPLKGTVVKDYYPVYGMRQMADRDILVDAGRAADVRRIMEELGFTTQSFGTGNHDVYFKEPVCNFEIHRSLFGPVHDPKLRAYYQNVEERLIPCAGQERRFSPEDLYVYVIAHEYKHYVACGTGLKSVLDTYVLLTKESLDMRYVAAETEKLGIRSFEERNRSLALHLFAGAALTEEDQKMLAYILTSGTYGTMAHFVENGIAEKGRWKFFLSRLSLPREVLASMYPVLKKAPFLYPVFWTYRLIHALLFRRGVVRYQLKAALTKDK